MARDHDVLNAGGDPEEAEDGPIGIFPSWRAVYVAVLVYTGALIAILYIFTRLLDKSGG